jgi:hypothetical protein
VIARDPLNWYIEVCAVCGCQLGPGIGSRTSTGRCVVQAHHSTGGTVVRVVARPSSEQDVVTRSYFANMEARGVRLPRAALGVEGEQEKPQ